MSISYQALLIQLAKQAGVDAEALASTEEIVIDGISIGLQLDGTEQEGDVLFFTTLGAPAVGHFESIARTLLEANSLWVGTGGCTLGIQPETGEVTLCGRAPLAALDGSSMAEVLAGFTDLADFWKKYVAGHVNEERSTSLMLDGVSCV